MPLHSMNEMERSNSNDLSIASIDHDLFQLDFELFVVVVESDKNFTDVCSI